MKRLAVIICMVICMNICILNAVADEVSLHNGVHFGMTHNELVSAESFSEKYHDIKAGDNGIRCTFGNGKLAGIDDSLIEYYFNDGRVHKAYYGFGTDGSKYEYSDTAVKNDYTKINDALIAKYGEPLGNVNGTFATIHTSSLDSYSMMRTLIALASKRSTDYDEWFVSVDGGYVKIEHYYTWMYNENGVATHALIYQFYTTEEVANLVGEIYDDI